MYTLCNGRSGCGNCGSRSFENLIFSPGEAARTRSVAKRSLKESGMVASRVATKTVGEWEW